MKKEYIVWGAVAILVIIGGFYLARPIINVAPAVNLTPNSQDNFGAVSGNEIQGRDLIVGGVVESFYSCRFNNTSTTSPCSFKTPNATTTVLSLGAALAGNTGTKNVYIAKAATNWATTTNLMTLSIGQANGLLEGQATSTLLNNTLLDNVLPPNVYVNLGLDGVTHATGTMMMRLRQY